MWLVYMSHGYIIISCDIRCRCVYDVWCHTIWICMDDMVSRWHHPKVMQSMFVTIWANNTFLVVWHFGWSRDLHVSVTWVTSPDICVVSLRTVWNASRCHVVIAKTHHASVKTCHVSNSLSQSRSECREVGRSGSGTPIASVHSYAWWCDTHSERVSFVCLLFSNHTGNTNLSH